MGELQTADDCVPHGRNVKLIQSKGFKAAQSFNFRRQRRGIQHITHAIDGECRWVEHVGFADPSWGHLGEFGGGGTLLKGVNHSYTATGKLLLEPGA